MPTFIYDQFNQDSLQKYKKWNYIVGIPAFLLKLVTTFPFFEIFMLSIFIFLIYVGIKAISNEEFRPLVLNDKNSYENTKYILYFLIYTGVGGAIILSLVSFGLLQKAI